MENHIEMYVRDGIIRQNILWAVDIAAITQCILPDFLSETLEKGAGSWYSSGRPFTKRRHHAENRKI